MASGVEELLDMLFEMIDEAKNAPLSGGDKCVIARNEALDLIDDIRSQFPMELTEARKMMARRAELEAESKRKAESIVRSAEERVKQLLASDTVVLQAKQRANDMIRQAEERSRALKRSANDYCEDALRRTEEAVAEAFEEIKQSRSRFRTAAAAALNSTSGAQPQGGRSVFDADKN